MSYNQSIGARPSRHEHSTEREKKSASNCKILVDIQVIRKSLVVQEFYFCHKNKHRINKFIYWDYKRTNQQMDHKRANHQNMFVLNDTYIWVWSKMVLTKSQNIPCNATWDLLSPGFISTIKLSDLSTQCISFCSYQI